MAYCITYNAVFINLLFCGSKECQFGGSTWLLPFCDRKSSMFFIVATLIAEQFLIHAAVLQIEYG